MQGSGKGGQKGEGLCHVLLWVAGNLQTTSAAPETAALGLHTGLFLLPDAFLLGAKGATHHSDQRRSVDTEDCKMYESFGSRSQPWLPVKAVT